MKLIFSILSVIVMLSSCCKTETKNRGEIVNTVDINYGCWSFSGSNTFQIDNDSVYNSILNNPSCPSGNLPSIDFSKYTLLGNLKSGGCEVGFIRTVTRDNVNKIVNYSVEVNNCGLCKKLVEAPNFVLVEKIPADYSVKFQ